LAVVRVFSYLLPLTSFLFITSCGSDRQTFLLKGTFKGFNQGELYIYGVNGTYRLDTISVVKGAFRYEVALEDTVTLALVFPNFSELPVFAEPRAEVEIEGDASHLKETQISGTETNEAMTSFRLKTSKMTPPEATQAAETFIKENPASPISLYLLNKYFAQTPKPDYKKAIELINVLHKAQPDEPSLKGLAEKMKGIENLREGATLPNFTAKDINGKTVKSSDLNAPVNVIFTWAKWNYESVNMQRQLTYLKQHFKDKIKVIGICVDVDLKGCRKTAEQDSVKWSTICDRKMWEGPLVQQLGLSHIPDNIMTDEKGKIIAHHLLVHELQNKTKSLLNDKSP
jgi:peroxiredoxin